MGLHVIFLQFVIFASISLILMDSEVEISISLSGIGDSTKGYYDWSFH